MTESERLRETEQWIAWVRLAAVPFAMAGTAAQARKIDPSETPITLPDAIECRRAVRVHSQQFR